MRLPLHPLAVMAVCGALLVGCSPATNPNPTGSNAPQGTGTASGATNFTPGSGASLGSGASPGSGPSVSPAALPADSQWVTSTTHKIKFAAPKAWAVYDIVRVKDPSNKAAVEATAQRMGKTYDEYVQQVTSSIDVMVTGPASGDVTPMINVVKQAWPRSDDIPTVADMTTQLAGLDATVSRVDRVTTALGNGYAAHYTAAGPPVSYGVVLGLPSSSNTMELVTCVGPTAADADASAQLVITTLQAG
jgi:hypothetical protein